MSVNRVWLMGHVSAALRPTSDGAEFLVATVRHLVASTRIDRHLVRSADSPESLLTGAHVMVEGRLAFDENRQRHVIIADRIVDLAPPPGPGLGPGPLTSTHASPSPHERAGHWRRIGTGTPRERLVWVRATAVGAVIKAAWP